VCNVTSKERREERSGELELSTGCHARARSCDADVTTPSSQVFILYIDSHNGAERPGITPLSSTPIVELISIDFYRVSKSPIRR